jgi:hypothetical protein
LRVLRSLPDIAITIITITTLLNTRTHKTDFGLWQARAGAETVRHPYVFAGAKALLVCRPYRHD